METLEISGKLAVQPAFPRGRQQQWLRGRGQGTRDISAVIPSVIAKGVLSAPIRHLLPLPRPCDNWSGNSDRKEKAINAARL
jgi:hypothetical protein